MLPRPVPPVVLRFLLDSLLTGCGSTCRGGGDGTGFVKCVATAGKCTNGIGGSGYTCTNEGAACAKNRKCTTVAGYWPWESDCECKCT